jgi:CheY-like chemotaxis protein
MNNVNGSHMDLDGLGVLIVEDEAMVAMLIEDLLQELGCRPVEIASRVETALAYLGAMRFDIAILDVNLKGEMSFPVADALEGRGLPFVFATGYGPEVIPEKYRAHPVVQKPVMKHELKKALIEVMQGMGSNLAQP